MSYPLQRRLAAVAAAAAAAFGAHVSVALAGGGVATEPVAGLDPPLAQSAVLTLQSPSGAIKAVVYDGNEQAIGSSVSTTLSGFTVPAGAITAKTTAVVADGQCSTNGCAGGLREYGSGDTFGFTGGGGSVGEGVDAFRGSDPCPWGPDNCLWDTKTYDVSSALAAGDTSATAVVSSTWVDAADCINHEVQVLAVGPAGAWSSAGYVASGVGLRNQASGTIDVGGIPAGAKVKKAFLYWNVLADGDPGGAMQLDGQQVSSASIGGGPDPCWGNGGSFAYRADVTSLVSGNGTHTVSGYPTGTASGANPWTGSSPPMMEGATLIVFYEKGAPTFDVSFSTFIPTDHVPGAPQAFCGFPPHIYVFAGDNRSFDPNATSFRTRQLVSVIPDESASSSGLQDGSIQELVGQTKAYAPDALDDGKIDSADDDGVLHDCHLLDDTAYASTSNMHVDVTRVSSTKVSVHLHGGASNPLVRGAPAIDWDLTLTIDTSTDQPHWTLKGSHDGFPAYEVYVNGQTIYTYSPGPGPYGFFDLLKLFPPLDVSVDRSGDLP